MATMHFDEYNQQHNVDIEHHILSSDHLTLAMECAENGFFLVQNTIFFTFAFLKKKRQ